MRGVVVVYGCYPAFCSELWLVSGTRCSSCMKQLPTRKGKTDLAPFYTPHQILTCPKRDKSPEQNLVTIGKQGKVEWLWARRPSPKLENRGGPSTLSSSFSRLRGRRANPSNLSESIGQGRSAVNTKCPGGGGGDFWSSLCLVETHEGKKRHH